MPFRTSLPLDFAQALRPPAAACARCDDTESFSLTPAPMPGGKNLRARWGNDRRDMWLLFFALGACLRAPPRPAAPEAPRSASADGAERAARPGKPPARARS